MYHSIYIGDKNTWDDFYLIPTTRPLVNSPEPRTMYVDVYGIDGTLDLSTALTGGVLYKNREGSWEFIVENGHENWEVLHHKLSNYLHGKKFKIVLEDDPGYYYLGRLSLEEWKSDNNWSVVTIKYYLDPYKYEMTSSVEDWLWDPFSFETGIVREYGAITVNGSYILNIPGSERPVIPAFTVASTGGTGMTVTFEGVTYTFADGTYRNPNIVIREDGATLTIQGNGNVSVHFQGGWL